MNEIEIAGPGEPFAVAEVGVRKVDASRGQMSGVLNSQWSSRPDDERFLSLRDLHEAVKARSDNSTADVIDVKNVRIDVDDAGALRMEDKHGLTAFEHWSFGQTCNLLGVPAEYLRRLNPTIAGINLQYGVETFRSEMVKTYRQDVGADATALRAVTGPNYGRITDSEVVEAFAKIAGDGDGSYGWKVPGRMNWSTGEYNPDAAVTKESTTLYASDRDVWLFLVDDKHPIEIGKLPDGSPDYVFRGIAGWNSEVGSKSFGLASWYLRGVCQNRCIWGIEGFEEIRWNHSKGAPERFLRQAQPAMSRFANSNSTRLLEGVKAAKDAVVAANEEERLAFLQNLKFSRKGAQEVIDTVLQEEGKPATSIWDFVQGITAKARSIAHTDDRVAMERVAGRLLDKVAA